MSINKNHKNYFRKTLTSNLETRKACLLKKLKCFHSAPSVSKQRSEILFCYWRTGKIRRKERVKMNNIFLVLKCISLINPSFNTHGILDRWRVAEGGKMFWKFLDPGFLKRCNGELPKSFVSPWSSSPSRGSCTVWCLDRVTRIIFPYIFCPLRWFMAIKKKNAYFKKSRFKAKILF